MARLTAYVSAASRHLLDTDGMRARLDGRADGHDCRREGGTPVVLVHGYLARKSCWLDMISRLHADGHHHIRTASYSVFQHGVEEAARRVYDKVCRVSDEHDGRKVAVVGHSMGGVATLYAATRFGLDDRLARVVTLGTPYGGSPVARAAVPVARLLRTARQLSPSSRLLEELRSEAAGLTVPWTVLYSPTDELVPARLARLDAPVVTHRQTPAVGHAEMLFSRRVARMTSAELAA